jgi:hypothetical protein
MTSTTHTTAGLLADAAAARLDGRGCLVAASSAPAAFATTGGLSAAKGVYGHHQLASWTVGAIAKPATSMVFDRKNRPTTTRPLSEHSP